MVPYQVYVFDPYNAPLGVLPYFKSIKCALAVNQIGAVTLVVPGYISGVGEDTRIEIYRDGALLGETQFLVTRMEVAQETPGKLITTIYGSSAMTILDWPVVDYAPGKLQSWKSGYAGNVIRQLVRENLGSMATDPARDMSTYFTVPADINDGAIVSIEAGWQRLMPTIQDLVNASYDLGVPIYFDVVKSSAGQLELKTYVGQRGTDRSTSVVLSIERKTIINPVLTFDWTNATSRIVVGGTGQELWRVVTQVVNVEQANNTPFGYIKEEFLSSTGTTIPEIQQHGYASLQAKANRVSISGQPSMTGSKLFGRDYFLGDKVAIEFLGNVALVDINAIQISVEGNKETIDIRVSGPIV